MEGPDSKKKRSPAVTGAAAGGGSGLTEGLIVDILSRIPVKSICRFKCVCPSWRSLISHPDSRKKLPQTLARFFYFDEFDSCVRNGRLRPPSLCDFAFLPANTGGGPLDCCNGLVLLNSRSSEQRASYVVCNPATEKWTTVPPVPEPTQAGKICVSSILCFDPAVWPHFHVVRLLEADEDDGFTEEILFEGFEIYSETGGWVFHPHNSGWSPQSHRSRRTYFNGFLHFITRDERAVAALDMKGQTRRTIPVPRSKDVELIGHSQGRLFYADRDDRKLSIDQDYRKLRMIGAPTCYQLIYVLEGHGRWTLKHCVNTSRLFADADEYSQSGLLVGVAGIHPHCNSIFLFDSLQGRLMFYNMDSRSARVTRSVSETCLWSFVPYVPLYLETPALENGN
ncbi:hypothetical protein SETIT_9G354400v2 [Setaria italica]|uniref:F-box domain-containing protein n=1 Tax=Setaria italica TaxID=4555 RepID=A0A368SP92_SETIT|nr:hypothetical protein SETIT_9G354400v2 [Setaria italica]